MAAAAAVAAATRDYTMDRYEPKIYALYHTRFQQVRLSTQVTACKGTWYSRDKQLQTAGLVRLLIAAATPLLLHGSSAAAFL
jgi:hypothetical protein